MKCFSETTEKEKDVLENAVREKAKDGDKTLEDRMDKS
jgi:hypothetical protein